MNQPTSFSRSYYIFLMVFLGLLSAFGPYVTDMYLPTLPSMTTVFDTSTSLVQMGLATSMLGLAFGQIFFGPISDKYGRRHVLIISMLLFAVSTIFCIYAPTIEYFNACRFVQGLGGAGGIVLSRSISTDCYSGRELAKTLAIIGAINGVAPVTAPVVGGLVSEAVGWKGIFWILFGIGIFLLLLTFVFKESLPKEKRQTGSIFSLMKDIPALLKKRRFRQYILLFVFTESILFAYISSASFIVQDYFGHTELFFSVTFAVNSIGTALGSAMSLKFKDMKHAARFGAYGIMATTVAQVLCYLCLDTFICYESLTFVMLVFIGFIFTAATTLTMEEGREHIGSASAIFGASGFLFGGIVTPLVGIGNIMSTTLIIITFSALITLYLALLTKKKEAY